MRTDPESGKCDVDIQWQGADDHGAGQVNNVAPERVEAGMLLFGAFFGSEENVAVVLTPALYAELLKLLAVNLSDAFEAVSHYNRRFGESHPMTGGARYVCQDANDLFNLVSDAYGRKKEGE